jgi:hypothetical protein
VKETDSLVPGPLRASILISPFLGSLPSELVPSWIIEVKKSYQGDERAKRVLEQLRKGEAAGLTINEKCGSEIFMRKFVYERMLY